MWYIMTRNITAAYFGIAWWAGIALLFTPQKDQRGFAPIFFQALAWPVIGSAYVRSGVNHILQHDVTSK